MRRTTTCAAVGFAAALAAATGADRAAAQGGQAGSAQETDRLTATAALQDRQGKPAGRVTLTQYDAGVVVRGELQGLPPGWHAIHVHETGECEPDFEAAGGHFAGEGTQHGLDQGEPHAGDLGNFWVTDAGTANFEMITDRFALADGAEIAATDDRATAAALAGAPSVLDRDGAAVMVHAKPDDYATDPSGASGDRLACGVIDKG